MNYFQTLIYFKLVCIFAMVETGYITRFALSNQKSLQLSNSALHAAWFNCGIHHMASYLCISHSIVNKWSYIQNGSVPFPKNSGAFKQRKHGGCGLTIFLNEVLDLPFTKRYSNGNFINLLFLVILLEFISLKTDIHVQEI